MHLQAIAALSLLLAGRESCLRVGEGKGRGRRLGVWLSHMGEPSEREVGGLLIGLTKVDWDVRVV